MIKTNLSQEDERLLKLLDDEWNYTLENIPEIATFLGNHEYDNRLTDFSEHALQKRHEHNLKTAEILDTFDMHELSKDNKINYKLYCEKIENEIREYTFFSHLMPLNQMDGVQNSFLQTMQMMPFKKEKDFQNYLARLKSFPRQIDQIINLLKKGIETGYTVPKSAIINVVSQIEGQIPEDYKESMYYKLLGEHKKISKDLIANIENVIQNDLYPSFKRLSYFLKDTYIPNCRDTFGLGSLPNGIDFYNHKLRMMTTTDLSAEQIHKIGHDEVDRIYLEMVEIADSLGFKGKYKEFLNHLETNQDLYFKDPKDLMLHYRDIAKRADQELPALFKVLPRLPYGVVEIPPHQAPSYPTAYYMPPDMAMTRAGIFYANTHQLEIRPKYEMEALTLHEAVPGHHLQIALSLELDNLPKFRRMAIADYTGYIEGWGLYSEKLGEDMGFYKDKYSKFGQLSFEIWRACRLVVDTGLHAFEWSRDKAIQYLHDKTGKSFDACAVEVDRYMSIPGQATAYKIGELKILELKQKFMNSKGDDFDIREFHDVILKNGAIPLNVLEDYVNEYLNN
ncbi:MAG: DUF885 domain-containing protein [Candidatus Sericytochromatia bacterium]